MIELDKQIEDLEIQLDTANKLFSRLKNGHNGLVKIEPEEIYNEDDSRIESFLKSREAQKSYYNSEIEFKLASLYDDKKELELSLLHKYVEKLRLEVKDIKQHLHYLYEEKLK